MLHVCLTCLFMSYYHNWVFDCHLSGGYSQHVTRVKKCMQVHHLQLKMSFGNYLIIVGIFA